MQAACNPPASVILNLFYTVAFPASLLTSRDASAVTVKRIQNSPHLSDVEHDEQQHHHETHSSSFGGLCIQHSVLRRKNRGQKKDVALNQKLQIPGAHSEA